MVDKEIPLNMALIQNRTSERSAIEAIEQQLRSRKPCPPTVWRNQTEERIAFIIADACAEAAGWPPGRFYPSDPFRIMIFEDMADVDVSIAVRRAFGINLAIEDMKEMAFAQVVAYIRTQIEGNRFDHDQS